MLIFPLTRTDGRTDRRTDGPTDKRTDGPRDKASYRVAFPQLKMCTIHSNYRQVVLRSTLDFLLVYTQNGLLELGSSFKEIFLVAPFEKNPKLTIFYPVLHTDFRGLLKTFLDSKFVFLMKFPFV